MIRAIYNCCYADPWIDVAKRLQKENSIEPVYWIGYEDDNSKQFVSANFQDTIYHSYYSAWKGEFPKCIDDIAQNYCVDIDFYSEIGRDELIGLNIMDRMDPEKDSFNYAERRELFRRFLRYWLAIIDTYQIDIVISASIPHRSFDFPLYLVCKQKKIKFYSSVYTSFESGARVIASDCIYSIPEIIEEDWLNIKKGSLNFALSDDIAEYLSRIANKSYQEAIPAGMKELNIFHKNRPSYYKSIQKFLADVKNKNQSWIGKDGFIFKGFPTYCKQKKVETERSKIRINFISYCIKIIKRVRFLRKLENEYSTIAIKTTLQKPYVLFALHYQPEETTMPRANIFYNQLYIIELLSTYLPKSWNIYIKENPLQFNPRAEGQASRLVRFYTDAIKFPRVSFVPINYNPFDLIDSAVAIVTLTGTIGWEAIVRKKPVICFGQAWYESYKHGVLRIRTNEDIQKMERFIKAYQFSENELIAYLKSIEMHSTRASYYRNIKKRSNLDDEVSVNNLIDLIVSHFNLEKTERNHND
ncbi:MAG: hypothetical protein K9J13_07580 [Saprospiraceae bacterium]|nr:hypothetical protein [Saprospiraceae bacterium]